MASEFEPLFSAESAATILRLEEVKFTMRRAAYGVILTKGKTELIEYLSKHPVLVEQAPELIEWLRRYSKGKSHEAKVLKAAADRLAETIKCLPPHQTLH